jgi:CRP-like cAMP-binding protein
VLGVDIAPLRGLVQGAGTALRLSAARFRREVVGRPALRRVLHRYAYVRMAQLAQMAACGRHHDLHARLARWLLMTQDRAHTDRFHLTHQLLAVMLGVRREGVTEAAGRLQKRRIIAYRRGEVQILDRRGLEGASCSCYRIDLATYQRVFN